MSPERERNRRQIIYERDGVAVFREIHASEKKLAGVAGFHADVGQLLCYVDRELAFSFFAARGAQDSAEFPLLGAKRAQQETFAAVAFHSQHTHYRPRCAQGANPRGHYNWRHRRLRGAKFGIRLQERPSKELCQGSDLLVVVAGVFPVCFQACNPGIRRQQGHLVRGFRQCRRGVLFDRGEQAPEVGQKHGEVEWTTQLDRERAGRFYAIRGRDVCAKRFLKRGDVLVEIEKFSGERVFRGQPLTSPDTRVVLGPTGLGGGHLRGVDDPPTISLYQPGWKRLAKAMETSPRMTEVNARRSANTPM